MASHQKEKMKIETERTIIRLPKDEDFNFIKNLWLDGEVMKYVGFPKGLKVPDEEINLWLDNENPKRIRLVVEEKSSGQLIAETGWQRDGEFPYANGRKSASLEIKIAKPFWGQGFGTEILKTLIDYIFKNTETIVVFVDPNIENVGANKLYKKLGFKSIGKPISYIKNLQVPIKTQYFELKKEVRNDR